MTFPVQPDPISGMHCWHQKVTLQKAEPGDRYGDVFVDTERSHEVYRALAGEDPRRSRSRRPAPAAVDESPLAASLEAFYVQGAAGGAGRDAVPSEETWYYAI